MTILSVKLISLLLSISLCYLCCCRVVVQASFKPQMDTDRRRIDPESSTGDSREDLSQLTRDPLRWIWIDETSLELAWSSKFSLSLNDAVKGYSLSLTNALQNEPFSNTIIYSSSNLQHQFSGLKSNLTYEGKLEALVGPHFWPYNLLNFTFASAVLVPGAGLGQNFLGNRSESTTADLGNVAVGVTLRWSHSPFITGELKSNEWDSNGGRPGGQKPNGYLLQIWDTKQPIFKLISSVTGKHEGCIAAIDGLSLDTIYKATLQSLHDDGRIGTTLSFAIDTGGFYVAGGGLTTDGVSDCYSGLQVRCPLSERCVSPYWICDGAPDCPDGEDEIGCDKSPCDGFRCYDDICIPGAWRCDGHKDCKDGDDEFACSGCNEGQIACATVGFCFSPNVSCNGIPDCPDGWDESLAICGGKKCSPGELPCWDNNHCVQHARLCDGTPDCPTSEDEDQSFCIAFKSMQETTTLAVDLQASLCEQKTSNKRSNCSLDEYQCKSGDCIPKIYMCNGHLDCHSGDDEDLYTCSVYTTEGTDLLKDIVPSSFERIPIENSTIFKSVDNTFTAPVLQDIDLNSIEATISEENTQFEIEPTVSDFAVEVDMSEENSEENTFGEIEFTTSSDYEKNLYDYYSEVLESPVGSLPDGASNVSNINDNFFINITDQSIIPIYDILENYDVSLEENEVDDVIINGTIKPLKLDSDEEHDIRNSTDLEETSHSIISDEITINTTNDEHISVTVSDIQKNYNSSSNITSMNNQNEIVNLTTTLPLLESPLNNDSVVMDYPDTITSDPITEYDLFSPSLSSESAIGSIEGEIENNENEIKNTPTVNDSMIVDNSDQPMKTEIPELLSSTEMFEFLQPLSTLVPLTLENSDNNLPLEEEKNPSTSASPLPTNSDVQLSSIPEMETSSTTATQLMHTNHSTPHSRNGTTKDISHQLEGWKEIGIEQKNLTILIAVHSLGNESKIPQYIIHGDDGSTYEYEVVAVNESINKTEANLRENRKMIINEEYTGSIHLQDNVSSGATLTFCFLLIVPSVLDILINI